MFIDMDMYRYNKVMQSSQYFLSLAILLTISSISL
jgi:hypothetical protein